jgi:hypothetical protein
MKKIKPRISKIAELIRIMKTMNKAELKMMKELFAHDPNAK